MPSRRARHLHGPAAASRRGRRGRGAPSPLRAAETAAGAPGWRVSAARRGEVRRRLGIESEVGAERLCRAVWLALWGRRGRRRSRDDVRAAGRRNDTVREVVREALPVLRIRDEVDALHAPFLSVVPCFNDMRKHLAAFDRRAETTASDQRSKRGRGRGRPGRSSGGSGAMQQANVALLRRVCHSDTKLDNVLCDASVDDVELVVIDVVRPEAVTSDLRDFVSVVRPLKQLCCPMGWIGGSHFLQSAFFIFAHSSIKKTSIFPLHFKTLSDNFEFIFRSRSSRVRSLSHVQTDHIFSFFL